MSISESEQIFYDKSQTYWKWLIKVKSRRLNKPVLILWLTDKSDNNMDKLVLTKSNQIVGAVDHTLLFKYIKDHKDEIPDPVNTITWMNEVKDLDTVSLTKSNINIIENALDGNGFNKESINESIGFINLFNDLAYQLDDDALFELSRKRQIRDLWEFGYNEIFWKELGHQEVPAVRIPQFSTNFKLLNRRMNLMIDTFINRIEILDP